MKKFILKSLLFTAPFLFSYVSLLSWSSFSKGDLLRISNIIDETQNYRDIFLNQIPSKIYYTNLTEIGDKKEFDLLTIGDSFSVQEISGYQNFLSESSNIKVLHYNIMCDPFEVIYGLLNGDLFDKIHLKYVLIESAEKYIIERSKEINRKKTILLKPFLEKSKLKEYSEPEKKEHTVPSPKFFSQSTIRFSIHNLLYHFDDNAFISDVYKVKTSKKLFSINKQELLFYHDDLDYLSLNNRKDEIQLLNKELNLLASKLNEHNIKLVLLVAPDKYDIYYNYIQSKSDYGKPMFFYYLEEQKKDYIYIDSKRIIESKLGNVKDLYYYDDTHWTPIVAKDIANAIKEKLALN